MTLDDVVIAIDQMQSLIFAASSIFAFLKGLSIGNSY